MMRVTTKDCQDLGFCMKSVRPWFDKHGLDFRDFVKNGIPVEELALVDDELARRAIQNAEQRAQSDGQ